MSDFGEYIPYDARLWSGESAAEVHNAFPGLWAQTCREAQREAGRDGDVVFWSRSASPTSPRWATSFWAGDQLTVWDAYDGLASALRGMLSGGLSGMSVTHADLGGYTMIDDPGLKVLRSKELLFRWMEMGAFSDSIFRSHPGNLPNRSAQVYSDDESLLVLSRTARMHAALWPYRKQLLQRAAARGTPPLRYTFYEYPADPVAWNLSAQFLLGPELLVAPVLHPNVSTVRLYLPRGRWMHLWTERVIEAEARSGNGSGSWIDAHAPLGRPAAYFRLPLTPTTQQALKELQMAASFTP